MSLGRRVGPAIRCLVAFSIDLGPDELTLSLRGWDRMWCLASEVRVPWSAVTTSRALPRSDALADLGWRTGGTYWPGRVAKGHYAMRGRKGARQFWCVGSEDRLLVVDTTLERPARLVVGLPAGEVEATADAIARRVS